jgi:hypothetical protein
MPQIIRLMNNNKIVGIVTIIAVAAILITGTAISQDAFQIVSFTSQIQADGNAVNVIGTQSGQNAEVD